MRKSQVSLLAVLLTAAPAAVVAVLGTGCASEREVVVTRDQFGERWPLAINSARVLCGEDGSAVLQLGTDRYGLDPGARERGYPDAATVARQLPVDPANPEVGSWPADTAVLAAACETDVASR